MLPGDQRMRSYHKRTHGFLIKEICSCHAYCPQRSSESSSVLHGLFDGGADCIQARGVRNLPHVRRQSGRLINGVIEGPNGH